MIRQVIMGWFIAYFFVLQFEFQTRVDRTGHSSITKQIPVICYHNIRHISARENLLWIDDKAFAQQMQSLYDSGYHTILPDQLYLHLTTGKPLPAKSILISFDDSHENHYIIAKPILDKLGFKAVFFIMTVTIGKKNYLTIPEIKALSDMGHVIGCHTYDHPVMHNLKADQWDKQIGQPKRELEKITGKPVVYFAYPFGVWNEPAITELKNRGIKAAFQLTDKPSEKNPLFTIRRIMVSGNWTGVELQEKLHALFKN